MGRAEQAIGRLSELISRASDAGDGSGATTQAAGLAGVLASVPASSTIDIDLDAVVLEARLLRNLMVQNRDPQQGDLALRTLLSLDPHSPMYRQNLERLYADIPQRFPLTRLTDDLRVMIAKAQPSRSMRIEQLQNCIEGIGASQDVDALARAAMNLGWPTRTTTARTRPGPLSRK